VSKYFNIQPGLLVYNGQTKKSNTTPTTFPANPRVDGVQVETWNNFGEEVRKFMAQQVSTVTTEPHGIYDYVSEKVASMRMKYDSEREVESCFLLFYHDVVERANLLSSGQKVKMSPPNNTRLHPDLGLLLQKGSTELLLAVIEVKTPKAFPYEGNLAERFKDEQLRLKPNPATLKSLRSSSRREQALEEKVLLNQNKDTKVSRAICQLWGYMTVNHLKYGILTTFNETFFFKREFREDLGTSKLEISPGVRIGDSQTPIVGALCYFTSLLLESHLYTSPYSIPTMPRKDPVQLSKYEVANVNLYDFHFSAPTDFKAHHVISGQYLQNKSSLFKLLDTTNDGSSSMFWTELEAYQRLDELQGNVVPVLEQSYLMSSFLFAFALEDCGNPITQPQLHRVYDQVVRALKSIHEKGVVHGDIALRNILINSSESRVVLVDFGLAKFFVSHEQEKEGLECVTSDIEWKNLCEDELLKLEQLL
jgi:hypothetical protein